jgi:hypothetical protein
MTFPRRVNSFSPVFRKLLQAAVVRQVRVEYDTEANARSTAATMRSYVGKLFKADPKEDGIAELVACAQACMFRVEGRVFIAQPRSMDARYDKLNKALDDANGVGGVAAQPTTDAATDSLSKLLSAMQPAAVGSVGSGDGTAERRVDGGDTTASLTNEQQYAAYMKGAAK